MAFEDDELEDMSKLKGNLSWHDFILSLTKGIKTIYKIDFNLDDIETLLDKKFEELKR